MTTAHLERSPWPERSPDECGHELWVENLLDESELLELRRAADEIHAGMVSDEAGKAASVGTPAAEAPEAVDAEPTGSDQLACLRAIVELLADVDGRAAAMSDAERIDLITACERIKGAVAAAQARVSVAFADSQVERARTGAGSVRAAERGIAPQLALAQRCSPATADRLLSLARALTSVLPHTMAALRRGVIGPAHAAAVHAASACLNDADTLTLDERLRDRQPLLSVKHLRGAADHIAAELDPASVVARHDKAVQSRGLWTRPAPDGMAYLTVLGPLTSIVGAYAALHRHATAVTAGRVEDDPPDGRCFSAVLADTALNRLAGLGPDDYQPVAVTLIMTPENLFGKSATDARELLAPGGRGEPRPDALLDRDPAARTRGAAHAPGEGSRCAGTTVPVRVSGHGSLPAVLARRLLLAGCDDADDSDPPRRHPAEVTLRRAFTSPDGRDLVALESNLRLFPPALRRLLVLRDDTCRMPFCDAPIRHADHITPATNGGPTSYVNGQGLSARCNYTKDLAGFTTRVLDAAELARFAAGPEQDRNTRLAKEAGADTHVTAVTTPTGHTYLSVPPPALGWSGRP